MLSSWKWTMRNWNQCAINSTSMYSLSSDSTEDLKDLFAVSAALMQLWVLSFEFILFQFEQSFLVFLVMIYLQINKFKNALAKHGKDQSSSSSSSIGPAKGLEVKELLSLASSGEIDQLSYSLSSSM